MFRGYHFAIAHSIRNVPNPIAPQPSIATTGGTFAPLLRLALPVLAGQFLDMLVGFSDVWLTGNYLPGEQYLAAMNLAAYLLWFLMSLFSLVSIGATAMVARFIGARDAALAQRTANQAFVIGGALCALPVLMVTVAGPTLVRLLGLDEPTGALVLRYLWLILPAVPAIMLEQVGVATLRGAGDTATGVIAMIVVNAVDIAVSYCLVRGVGPFPQLGWDGLAIGTTVGYIVGTTIVLYRLIRGPIAMRLEWRLLRPDWALMRRLLRVSIPGGFDILALIACQLWFVQIVNGLGNLQAAAHGVAIRIESVSYMPGIAFQVAITTIVGQLLGAGESRRAERSVVVACVTTGLMMSAMSGLLWFGAGWLAAQFVSADQAAIGTQAAGLVRIVAIFQPVLAVVMIVNGALRGAGDTRWPLLFTFIGFIVVRIPLAYALAWSEIRIPFTAETIPLLGLGVRGAWYAMVTDLSLRCTLAIWRFRHGGWKRVVV